MKAQLVIILIMFLIRSPTLFGQDNNEELPGNSKVLVFTEKDLEIVKNFGVGVTIHNLNLNQIDFSESTMKDQWKQEYHVVMLPMEYGKKSLVYRSKHEDSKAILAIIEPTEINSFRSDYIFEYIRIFGNIPSGLYDDGADIISCGGNCWKDIRGKENIKIIIKEDLNKIYIFSQNEWEMD